MVPHVPPCGNGVMTVPGAWIHEETTAGQKTSPRSPDTPHTTLGAFERGSAEASAPPGIPLDGRVAKPQVPIHVLHRAVADHAEPLRRRHCRRALRGCVHRDATGPVKGCESSWSTLPGVEVTLCRRTRSCGPECSNCTAGACWTPSGRPRHLQSGRPLSITVPSPSKSRSSRGTVSTPCMLRGGPSWTACSSTPRKAAGAEVVHGQSVVGLLRAPDGRVRGAKIAGADRHETDVATDLVIGADGVRSRVARMLEADLDYTVTHTTASIYGYWRDLGLDGYHWFYNIGAAVGAIPTNDGNTCVFASLPPTRFENGRRNGIEDLHRDVLSDVSPELASRVAGCEGSGKLRAFAGQTGFLRRAAGPGWALVGDAGYFKDPLTAHGMTDALRDAELLARAVVAGGDDALAGYQVTRDELVKGLLDVTDRISSFEWDLDEVKEDPSRPEPRDERRGRLVANPGQGVRGAACPDPHSSVGQDRAGAPVVRGVAW